MTTRPLPPHGSEARYKGSTTRPACDCRTCIDGWTRAGKVRALARLNGTPASIPTDDVTRHIQHLYSKGWTAAQIASAAGVNTSTVYDHGQGKFPRIRRSTADRILAVQPGLPSIGRTPAHGARRRIQALCAAGHSYASIAATAGLSDNGVRNILDQRELHVSTDAAIRSTYQQLAGRAGTSNAARARAATAGWPDPTWWEDYGGIDDPDVDPATVIEVRTLRVLALAEDWEWLAAQGYSRTRAAERLGVTKGALDTAIVRARRTQNDMETAA